MPSLIEHSCFEAENGADERDLLAEKAVPES